MTLPAPGSRNYEGVQPWTSSIEIFKECTIKQLDYIRSEVKKASTGMMQSGLEIFKEDENFCEIYF